MELKKLNLIGSIVINLIINDYNFNFYYNTYITFISFLLNFKYIKIPYNPKKGNFKKQWNLISEISRNCGVDLPSVGQY